MKPHVAAPSAPASDEQDIWRASRNNFDLVRLAAAVQVVIYHANRYILDGEHDFVSRLLQFFPGVPIFFFVSGFLISASYQRSSGRSYVRKRALRIFPALWLCIGFTVVALAGTGYLADESPSVGQIVTWIASQSTFVQFYNPDWSRHYGAGIINPALWTICVELQFYVMMPFLAWAFRKSVAGYLTLFAMLIMVSALYSLVLHPSAIGETGAGKLLGVTWLPWICMFMAGHLAWRYFPQLRRFVEGRATAWACLYTALAVVGLAFQEATGIYISGNSLVFILFAPLAMLVLAVAYTRPQTAAVLRGTDISYGLYLFHMPVIGTWLYLSGPRSVLAVPACLVLAAGVAAFSWFAVEHRALRFRAPVTPITTPSTKLSAHAPARPENGES